MAETIPNSADAIQSSIPPEAQLACDAYEWFWASVEGTHEQAVSEGKPLEPQPAPGAAYEAFLGR